MTYSPENPESDRKYVLVRLNQSWAVAVLWFRAEKPGDIGGVSHYGGPVYSILEEFDDSEPAQARWRFLAQPDRKESLA